MSCLLFFKIPLRTPNKAKSKAIQACLYFKPSVLHRDHNVSKDLQELVDRQNYFTKIPMITLNDTEFSG